MRWAPLLVLALVVAGCADPGDPSGTRPAATSSGLQSTQPGLPTQAPTSFGTGGSSVGLAAMRFGIVDANTAFAVDLAAQVHEPGKNLFTSPLSVSTALAMAYSGADGATREAMREALRYPDMDQETFEAAYRELLTALLAGRPGVTLELGNAAWIDDEAPVKPSYVERVESAYFATSQVMDLHAPQGLETMNGWAAQKTHGKIQKVLDEVQGDEILFLMNAVYFKGDWAAQFNATCTHKADFRRSDGSTVQADMMCGQRMDNITIAVEMDYRAARLPYAGHGVAMYVLVPEGDGTPASLLAGLRGTLTEALDGVQGHGAAFVHIPKFALKTHLDLKPALEALGMGPAFRDGADFSGIAEDAPLAISRVLHDAVVEVDEEGTVAAAVTTVGVYLTSVPPSITADRPFVVVVRDEATKSILFLGVVEDPTAA